MNHYEGGWPKDIDDITDANKRKKYIKKNYERSSDNTTDKFMPNLDNMTSQIKDIMREND